MICKEFGSLFWWSEDAVGVLKSSWLGGEAFSKVFYGVPFFVRRGVDIKEEFFKDVVGFVFSCVFFDLFRSICSLLVIEWRGVLMVVLDFSRFLGRDMVFFELVVVWVVPLRRQW